VELIFRHAWLLFIAVTCVNAAMWWKSGQKEIAAHPELRTSYPVLVRGLLVFGNLPWIVMGAGILLGQVPSTFHYLNPRNGSFVIAWYVVVVATWVATTYWIFCRGGAETLVRHPGLLNPSIRKPWVFKGLWLLSVAGGIAGLMVMIFADIRIPE
jgi:hypothetical protein